MGAGTIPDGILPIGDAICSFDPAFGQGMTVAALEAEALMDCLQRHGQADEAFRRDYIRRADAAIDVPWGLSSGENFKYPQTTGRRPLSFPLTRLYKDRLARCGDTAVIHDFYRVVSLSRRRGFCCGRAWWRGCSGGGGSRG